MAVVINEFEVVPGQSGADTGTETSSAGRAEDKGQDLGREISLLIEQQIQRDERVSAH